MDKSLCPRSNPQTAITVMKYPHGLEPSRRTREWVSFGFAVNKSVQSALPSDQKRAVSVFSESLYNTRFTRQRIEFWRTGSPSPQPVQHSRPQIALAVLIQIECSATKASIVSVALGVTISNRAELPNGDRVSAGPDGSFMILKDLENPSSAKFRILRKLAVFPTRQPSIGADPERPIARSEQTSDRA
jgi:hypothetical protein